MPHLIRFGPFELDLEAAELRSKGRSFLLPEQQFQILYMLLHAEGGVVSREEIRKRLWPNDTVVEFDRSINTAMMKLRLALGDTGDKPSYIETLVRRGYRLIVPAQREENKSAQPPDREARQDSLVGQKVSHYRVLGILGGGGMGLVYKGEDLKLGRPVALKFLPEDMATDPLTVQRFEREARTASSLNHPNICTIYEVEEHEGQPFIVMELLEGETLRELIARYADPFRGEPPGIPLMQLLDIAVQIAEGLNAAHETGIIHRDIKPANIFVTPPGRVKILDFGLAKAGAKTLTDPLEVADARDSPAPASHEVSIELSVSRTATPIGTAAYMSPEQVRGEKLDARSDLFSFGSILYEMATGLHPFRGQTATELSEAILRDAPAPISANVPSGLRSVILRCLEKSVDDRYQRAPEVRAALQALQQSPNSGQRAMEIRADKASGGASNRELTVSTPATGAVLQETKGKWMWGAMAGTILLLICVAIWYGYESGPPLVVTGTVRITNDGKAKIPVLPPLTDGVHLYFVEGQPFNSGSGIAQMSITGGETTWITTSLREILAVPAISPNGSKLLVAAGFAGGPTAWSQFWIQPLPAGTPYRVGHITGISGCFTPDGSHVLYGDGRVVKIVNLDGSDPHALTSVPGILRAPRFSSDGKRIRFWLSQLEDSATSIWEMGADGSNLHPLLPDWKEATNQCCGSWSPDGNYYYFQATRGNEQSIWVLPERRSIFRRTPAPFRLISGPLRFGAPGPGTDGKTLFVLGEETRVELFRYDLKAKRFDPYLKGLSAGPIDISPDGKWIAYVSYPDMTLWSSRLDLTQKTQLTFSPVRAYEPRWSPAGSRIAFMDVRPGRPWTISVLSTAGGDSPKPIEPLNQNGSESDPTWTPDGKSIVFSKGAADGKGAHAVYSLDLDKGNLLLVPGSDQVLSPRLSPDGKFISALRIGGNSLMLFDLKNNQWSTLTEGGRFSGNEWSRDGKYVYMRANRGGAAHLMRVRIKDRALEDVLDLTDFPALADDFANWIGVTPDGGALLMRDRSVQEIYALTLEKK